MTTSWINWNPRAYLAEYFPPIQDEWVCAWLVREAAPYLRALPRPIRAIDVGCGPTLCYAGALAPHIDSLTLADYDAGNRHEVAQWVADAPSAWDWSSYFAAILRYEDANPTTITARANLLRDRVTAIQPVDVWQPQPLGNAAHFDCVMSLFCADGVATSKAEWRRALTNTLALLRPGGVFIGAALEGCAGYPVGGAMFPSPNLSEPDIHAAMAGLCSTWRVTACAEVAEIQMPYSRLLCMVGIKQSETSVCAQ